MGNYCTSYNSCTGHSTPPIPKCPIIDLITNGDMEIGDTSGNTPLNWTITGSGERTGNAGLAHTGNYAAFLTNQAHLQQTFTAMGGPLRYTFSFFATYGLNQDYGRGLAFNDIIGLTVNVYYNLNGILNLLTTMVVQPGSLGSDYGFYRILTPIIPARCAEITVEFIAQNIYPGSTSELGVLIDDVSFIRV